MAINHTHSYSSVLDVILILDPFPLDGGTEYIAVHRESFTVACIATSSDPNIFVSWLRTDGMDIIMSGHLTRMTNLSP